MILRPMAKVLAVSDDPLGMEGIRLEDIHGTRSSPDVFVGRMEGGCFAAVMFARGTDANMTLSLADLKMVSLARGP
jgi:hypothetical protein